MNGSKSVFVTTKRQMADAPPSVCVSTDRPVPCISSSRSSRLRVLVLAQLPPPEHGASAVNRQVVSSKILSETFELAVIPISMTGDLARLRKFDVMKIWRSLALFGTVAGQLFGLGRPPDIVYFTLSPGGWAFYRDLALITLIRIAGIRCLFHLHGRGIAQSIESAPWRRRLYRFAFARSFVVTLSESLRGDIRGLVRQDQIFVVPNGVDDAVATQRHSEDVGAAQRPNNRVPRLLFVSNMLEEKGPLVLLEALAMVARRGVRFEARFAGAWRQSVSQERFEARVRELALQDRVEHRGPVYGSEKTRLFADSDLFVLPTYYRHEALPLVVIEAMMHGLPVVTTRIGALPEIIADKLNGELVEPGNIAQLGSALLKLLTDPDLCARYGRAARLKYEADLTAQRFEERLRDALLQVANRT